MQITTKEQSSFKPIVMEITFEAQEEVDQMCHALRVAAGGNNSVATGQMLNQLVIRLDPYRTNSGPHLGTAGR